MCFSEKVNRKRAVAASLALAIAGAGILVLALDQGHVSGESAARVPSTEAKEADRPTRHPAPASARTELADGAVAAAPGLFARAGWGARPNQLGRHRPQEGNPEAPMSLAFDSRGNTVVLDQVNGRLARYGKDGTPLGTLPVAVQAAQDVAFASDGTAAELDRLVDRTVALVGPDGALRGQLPVLGRGVAEGGGVTGLFVDGRDVYLEREHGALVRIGDTAGNADAERPEIPGRPTRDGLSFITAGLADASAGRLYVASIVRATREHRFTRELGLGVAVRGLVLLDTDRAGVIYLGVLGDFAGGDPAVPPAAVLLLCLHPEDGHPLGNATLPANTSADETFRELAVLDEGGVLYALRSEDGVELRRYDCR